jgi:hypothetical protein
MHYTLQYDDTLTFLQAATLLLLYSTPDLLRLKINSFTRLLLILTFSSAASVQPPGLTPITGLNLFTTSKFFAPLASVTQHTQY